MKLPLFSPGGRESLQTFANSDPCRTPNRRIRPHRSTVEYIEDGDVIGLMHFRLLYFSLTSFALYAESVQIYAWEVPRN